MPGNQFQIPDSKFQMKNHWEFGLHVGRLSRVAREAGTRCEIEGSGMFRQGKARRFSLSETPHKLMERSLKACPWSLLRSVSASRTGGSGEPPHMEKGVPTIRLRRPTRHSSDNADEAAPPAPEGLEGMKILPG